MPDEEEIDMTVAVTTAVFNEQTAGPTRNPLVDPVGSGERKQTRPDTPRRPRAPRPELSTPPSKVIQVHLDPELLTKLDQSGAPRGAAAMKAMADTYEGVRDALRPTTAKNNDNPFAAADAPRNHKLRPLASGKSRVSVALTVPADLFEAFETMRRELGASRGVLLEEAIGQWKSPADGGA